MIFPTLKELIQLKNIVGASKVLPNKSNNRTHGDYTSIFHGLGIEFETVRPYVIGDDVRYIDWRVSARIGKPQVKTFRAECDRNVFIILDANAYMRFGTRNTFKSVQAAKTAAILSWKSLQLQDRVGGLIFGDVASGIQYFKPTKHDSAVLRMLKVLCNQQTGLHQQVNIADALQHAAKIVTPQSLIFIISDFSCDDMSAIERALFLLRRRCTLVLLPVQDPSDSDIPPIGMLQLANASQNCMINTDDVNARNAYRARFKTYANQLQQIAKKLKSPLLWVETSVDPLKSLLHKVRGA